MNDKENKRLLGCGYWNQLKQRSAHRIVSKRGQDYEIHRDKWTTYRNFSNMNDHFIEEMCEAGAVEKLYSPIWLNKNGEECQPSKMFGCRVTHHIK